MAVTQEAIAIDADVVWMQLKIVMDRCPKLELKKPYWIAAER